MRGFRVPRIPRVRSYRAPKLSSFKAPRIKMPKPIRTPRFSMRAIGGIRFNKGGAIDGRTRIGKIGRPKF